MTDRDDLLRRVDLADLLDELSPSPRTRLGQNARWRCIDPRHEDQHPSVTMFTDSRGIERWRCWSGGHGGTAIDALLTARGGTVRDAIEELERRAGLPSKVDWPRRAPPPRPVVDSPKPVSADLLEYVAACERILWRPGGRAVREYLVEERGLAPDVLEANHVGADLGPRTLARAAGLPRSGVAAVLPTLDMAGRVTYVQARYLEQPAGRSRYDNPASSVARNPRLGVVVCPTPRDCRVLVVCEGTIDGLSAAGSGFRAMSVLGATYVVESLCVRLKEIAGGAGILIAFDGDRAGRAATDLLSDALGPSIASTVVLPENRDLNAVLCEDPAWLLAELSRGEQGPTLRHMRPRIEGRDLEFSRCDALR
jgi:DNA primase